MSAAAGQRAPIQRRPRAKATQPLPRGAQSDASLLPAGLRPVPLLLEQPAYIVAALRVQSRIERMPHRVERPADFNAYMTDLLHRAIEPETAEALRDDEEFLRADHFPEDAADE